MTLPLEELRAIRDTRDWLRRVASDRTYRPGWKELRSMAYRLLRHYPWPSAVTDTYMKAGRM